MTLEQREAYRKKQEAQQAAREAELKRRGKMVAAVAETDAGKEFLRFLHDLCGFAFADRVIRVDGQTDLTATALNSERRNIYLEIRGYMSLDLRKEIENREIDNKQEAK